MYGSLEQTKTDFNALTITKIHCVDPLETIKQVYRVDRKDISYLRFVFEGYDGIAAIKTIDPQKGIICLFIPPACKSDAEKILTHLKKELLIERLPVDAFTSEDLEP